MKKKYLNIILFVILLIFSVIYTYCYRPITDDELYNYGFAINILNNLIPYKDFNMIITPLFPYLLAGVLKIFGSKLIIYHIVMGVIIDIITFIGYRKIGYKSLIIYLILLIYPYTGYNIFCLLLFMVLLDNCDNNNYLMESIIISVLFMSKQTLGLLIIPSIIYSVKKRKTICIYLIFILLGMIYLVINNNLYEFIDYCVLGMFDFTSKNNTGIGIFLVIELVILFILIFLVIRYKSKDLFYVLLFQIMTFPTVNYYHFIISFVPVIYLVLSKIDNKIFVRYISAMGICFFVIFNILIYVCNDNYMYLSLYKENSFMKGRMIPNITSIYIDGISNYLDEYDDYTPYIMGTFSYLVKLNLDMTINKYDIINNGNMGYKGGEKYIEEIDNYCKDNKCIFIIRDEEINDDNNNMQVNKDILIYVRDNYYQIVGSNTYSVYVTNN